MDAYYWAPPPSSVFKRYQSPLQSRSGNKWDGFEAEMLMKFEEIDMDDDIREEYPCPFCSDYFDIVGLCCHIDDEHPVVADNGRKSRKAGSHSTLSKLRKELREGNLRSLFGGSFINVAPDPLFSSFILPVVEDYEGVPSDSSPELVKKSPTDIVSDRKVEQQRPMSIKDQKEKAERCDFVQGMLWSTILDDNL
ncbi:hypothetical protein DH2020_045178 [Rehmannia glutinosa]|uniref:Uncharacterized protein n=1 Tax=Rehmannia glutinosa TaxID=99300 RepID=A0ABR0UEV2_REHGL